MGINKNGKHKMKVVRNTYPGHEGISRAEEGNMVHWELTRGCFDLIRNSDRKTVFTSPPVNKNGLLRSNGKQPKLTGVIAQVKKHGWILELSHDLNDFTKEEEL